MSFLNKEVNCTEPSILSKGSTRFPFDLTKLVTPPLAFFASFSSIKEFMLSWQYWQGDQTLS
jgi:hypothetical protein